MRFQLTKISLLISLIGNVYASVVALEPRDNTPQPLSPDFSCGDTLFTGEFLDNIRKKAKKEAQYGWARIRESRLLLIYDGPPFTWKYMVWPISLKTGSYSKAKQGPYRAFLRYDLQVFSVVEITPYGFKECKMSGYVSENDVPNNFKCGGVIFENAVLRMAAQRACPRILSVSTHKFPARLDAPHFKDLGQQRYIYPIKHVEDDQYTNDPGPFRVVVNSACKVVGAVTVYDHGESFSCISVPVAQG